MSTTPGSLRTLSIEHQVDENGTPKLICRGRINLESAAAFRNEVKSLSPSHKKVLVDMSSVDAVDSSGLGSILGTYVSAKNDGCELILVNVHPRVKDLLNITRLSSVLSVQ
jgi:anti-sigma B factor antagonist